MDLRLANNSQGVAQLTRCIKSYLFLLKSRLFNDKIIILAYETRIWLTVITVSNTHGGKFAWICFDLCTNLLFKLHKSIINSLKLLLHALQPCHQLFFTCCLLTLVYNTRAYIPVSYFASSSRHERKDK